MAVDLPHLLPLAAIRRRLRDRAVERGDRVARPGLDGLDPVRGRPIVVMPAALFAKRLTPALQPQVAAREVTQEHRV